MRRSANSMKTNTRKTPARTRKPVNPILAADEQRAAQIDARLARFGDRAGQHGALAECQERLTIRVKRDTALRLVNLSRAVGIKHGAMVALLLDTVSRIDSSDFFSEIARLQKQGRG